MADPAPARPSQRADHLVGRYWPTSQQLVVVCGEPELVAQWFDAVREHHEACRDVLDLWDEPTTSLGLETAITRERAMERAMERMRHTLWAVRQWDVDT
jgi:hypothetical protein